MFGIICLNPSSSKSSINGSDSPDWLVRYEPWLKLLARLEIDSRLYGKFSPSDAVQQTMLEAWRAMDAFRGRTEGERQAWLRAILVHQLAHLARRYAGTQKRSVGREISIEHSVAQSAQRLENMLVDQGTSPSGIVSEQEQQVKLASLLDRLPADYREVIILRNLEDLPHSEIAVRMNRSEGAVRMLWIRALAMLRQELNENDRSN